MDELQDYTDIISYLNRYLPLQCDWVIKVIKFETILSEQRFTPETSLEVLCEKKGSSEFYQFEVYYQLSNLLKLYNYDFTSLSLKIVYPK